MQTKTYKCPCCGSPLAFDGVNTKLKCAACDNVFESEALEEMSAASMQGGIDFTLPQEGFRADEMTQMKGYRCKSCGAELITEETTTATECPYCGSPAILPDRVDSGVKPEKVIPFVVTKEQAQQQFHDYFKGKRLLPNVFLKGDNSITEMRKVYVPYWLFDCDAHANIIYDAEKRHVEREGDWEVTRTEHYIVRRSGSMGFENIPVDASAKLDDKIAESLEPYDLSAAIPFQPAVLAGSMADQADVDSDACERRASERVENSIADTLRSTVSGYTIVTERSRSVSSEGGKVTPVLMPVWLITTRKDEKTYTFAINGQTGKLTCDVPADKGKSFAWGGGVFAGVLGIAAIVMALADCLASGTLLLAAFAALIAALIVVGALRGQLKQAHSQSTAGNYVRKDSFKLDVQYERFLYQNVQRRKIETDKPAEEKTA